MSLAHAHAARPRAATSPSIDSLEPRRLFSIIVGDGELTVTGSSNADVISVTTPKSHKGYVRVSDGRRRRDVKMSYAGLITITANGGADSVLVDVPRMATKPDVYVSGMGGADTITTTDGNDTVYGGSSDDVISTGLGNDWVSGDDGNDVITGGAGNDTMLGGAGDDVTDGGSGDTVDAVTTIKQVATFDSPGSADQMVYSAKYNLLFLRNSGAAIRVINATTGTQVDLHLPKGTFTDIDLSPSGEYLYAADFGGEVIGYGTPIKPSYVHRFKLSTKTWDTASEVEGIAYRVEAVDDGRFITLSSDQWTDIGLHQFAPTTSTRLGEGSADFDGDIEYDPATSIVYQGNSGISSAEVHYYKVDLADNTFAEIGYTGTYNDAFGGYATGTTRLASDAQTLYYGGLELEALDPTHVIHTFDDDILAANANVAIGASKIYDAKTGGTIAALGFENAIATVSPDGSTFFVYDPASNKIVRYA